MLDAVLAEHGTEADLVQLVLQMRAGRAAATLEEQAVAQVARLGLLEAVGPEARELVVGPVQRLSVRLATAIVEGILEEREACARIAETLSRQDGELADGWSERIVRAIRERGRP